MIKDANEKPNRGKWTLRFERGKEARFLAYFYETNIGFLRKSFLAVTVVATIFNAFAYIGRGFVENKALHFSMLGLLAIIPAVGFALTHAAVFRRFYHACLSALIVTTSLVVMAAVHTLPAELRSHSAGGIFFILMLNFGLLRQRYVPAIINGIIVSTMYSTFVVVTQMVSDFVIPQLIVHFFLFVCGGGAIAWLFEWSQRNAFVAKETIEKEHERAEHLLLNILPMPIADRLKSSQTRIADRVEEVAVLFADIVGFTERAKSVAPEDLVSMLDNLFTDFDQIMELHGIEKIKTIGDSYMAAAGLLDKRGDHCLRLAGAALGIMEHVRAHYEGLSLRIGMHCGPVVAGVIGRKKMIYDLWGDTVNIASRMEACSEAGFIQVSEAFAFAAKAEFRFSDIRTIKVKGQGDMRVAFLEAPITLNKPAPHLKAS